MATNEYKIRNVLNPTDFATGSIGSFCHALAIAMANKSSLHLLHVETPGKRHEDMRFPRVRDLAAQWKLVPAGIEPNEFEKLTGVATKKSVLISENLAGGIASYADEHNCDLLVMTTRDKSMFRRFLDGSVSAAAAQATRLPALFLREGQSGFVSTNTGESSLIRVLLPVDGTVPATAARELATHLARSLGSEPHIVPLHVGQEPPARDRHMPHLELREGDVVETIVAFAQEVRANLIVMPSRGRDAAMEHLFGSTTERVIHEAPCPVLAVPENLPR